jgi:outer membrane protein
MARAAIRIPPILWALAVVALGPTASLAAADDIPNNTIRLGEYWVWYSVHASDLSGPFVPPGVGLDVNNTTTPYIAYLRRLSTHFTVELAAGVPPLTKTVGKGPAVVGSVPYAGREIATVRWLAPSLLFEYVFFSDSSALRPYIGVGLNYVDFYDRNSTAAGNAASGGPTRIELPTSLGVAGTVGLSYRLPHDVSMMASFSASRVTSHLTAITGDVVRSTSISFNPRTLVIAVGYSF